jgi:hypothetical protein
MKFDNIFDLFSGNYLSVAKKLQGRLPNAGTELRSEQLESVVKLKPINQIAESISILSTNQFELSLSYKHS